MDEKDKELLEEIQKNAQQTTSQLSKKLNMPITTVHHRLKKLYEEGIIRSIRAVLNPETVNKSVLSFILVSFDYSVPGFKEKLSQRLAAKKISEFPLVQEVHLLAGEDDMLIKVRGRDNKEISDFVLDQLRTVPGVSRTRTVFVMDTAKEDTRICLD